MGKRRHQSDKLWISNSEHMAEWGGKRTSSKLRSGDLAAMERLPFDHCALSMRPFVTPVASPDGYVFDFVHIVPYLKKKQMNPVTSQPLKVKDLVRLHFHKNGKGEYHCPVTFKVFNDFSHIIAVRETGNVFSYEAYEQLNKGPKYWHDLLNEEEFDPKKIITIQDPKREEKRLLSKFHFLNDEAQLSIAQSITLAKGEVAKDNFNEENSIQQTVREEIQRKREEESKEETKEEEKKEENPKEEEENLEGLSKRDRLLRKRKMLESDLAKPIIKTPSQFVEKRQKEGKRYNLHTEGRAAGSFTSTKVSVSQENTLKKHSAQDIREEYYYEVKSRHMKGRVQLVTNLGSMDIEVHCDYVPKTGENFIQLCEKKYYDGVTFHRLVPEFMIQGGDPEGTGKGGKSIFGYRFEDQFSRHLSHDSKGVLSMANAGPNTNGSQFFITFGPCFYLDNKHAVFGRVSAGLEIVDKMHAVKPNKDQSPSKEIMILEARVIENPYRVAIEMIIKREAKNNLQEVIKEMDKIKKRENLKASNSKTGFISVGKYLDISRFKKVI